MICKPCQEPHVPDDCIDEIASPPRHGIQRWCYCQHAPRRTNLAADLDGVRSSTDEPVIRDESEPSST